MKDFGRKILTQISQDFPASMKPERQRQIASIGGKAAHKMGKAHEFTSEEAKEAGRKGGKARQKKGK